MKHYIGIDIGGTKCAVVLGDAQGCVLQKIKFPTTDRKETLKRRDSGAAQPAGLG